MSRPLERIALRRAMGPSIALVIEEPRWRKRAAAPKLIRRAVKLALTSDLVSPARPMKAGREPQVTLLLANDQRLRMLNKQFRDKDRPTNVLSFPAQPGGAYLGDIAMAYGVIESEALAQQKIFSDHAAHLAIHGALHLLGYDHEDRAAAKLMEVLEIRLLAMLDIADPYAPRPYAGKGKAA